MNLDDIIDIYAIEVEYGNHFAEARSPYMSGVVEYGSDTYQALCTMVAMIQVTEEIIGKKLYNISR